MKELLFGVSQVSILGPQLFEIYICDLVLLKNNKDIVIYADDVTLYVYGENIRSTIESLEKSSDLLFQWFIDNHMKADKGKCYVLLSTNENVHVNIGTVQIQNGGSEKLLGVKIDYKLNFKDSSLPVVCLLFSNMDVSQ